MKNLLFISAVLLMFVGCRSPQDQPNTEVMRSEPDLLDQGQLATILGQRMSLHSGEKVLLVAQPGAFNDLVSHLENVIKSSNATYLGALSVNGSAPEAWRTPFTNSVLASPEDEIKELFKQVDLGIMLPGATPGHLPYRLLQEQLDEGMGRTIHFHWAGAYDLNGNLLPVDDEKGQFYLKVLRETDYEKLTKDQENFERAMRGQIIRVTTAAGTDLSFSIGDRPVTKQDGDASAARSKQARNLIDREVELPAGAIRVAPVETSVQGTIAFPDAQWNNQPVTGLRMVFENGKVIDITAETGAGAVEAELSGAGDAGRSFREFALGMNPLMVVQGDEDPWIPYYGYGAGIVRLSLGDNTELGGVVSGGYVRWNFFPDASVYVGDSLWVKDGKLLK